MGRWKLLFAVIVILCFRGMSGPGDHRDMELFDLDAVSRSLFPPTLSSGASSPSLPRSQSTGKTYILLLLTVRAGC